MSMLAERRAKQKYSLDPRNTAWTNDSNKFGQRMMESLGWTPGKGLGAKEDGRTEHVRVTKKIDNRGIGCTKPDSDAWTAHTDDFNDLLKNLSKEHATAGEESITKPKNKSCGPQKDRYGKHSKLKDVSKYGAEDLASILGKRKKTKRKHSISKEAAADLAKNYEIPREDSKDQAESEHGVTTITNKSSMQEYFAQKMAAIRLKRLQNEDESNSDSSSADDCKKQFSAEKNPQTRDQGDGFTNNIYLDGEDRSNTEIGGKNTSAVGEIIGKSREVDKKMMRKAMENPPDPSNCETKKKRAKKNASMIAESSFEDNGAFDSWVRCGTMVNCDGPSTSTSTKEEQKNTDQVVKERDEEEDLDKVIEKKSPSKKNLMTAENKISEVISKKKRSLKARRKTDEQVVNDVSEKTKRSKKDLVEEEESNAIAMKNEHVEDEEIKEACGKKQRSKKRKAQDIADIKDSKARSKNDRSRGLTNAKEANDCQIANATKSNSTDDTSSCKSSDEPTAALLRSKMDAFKRAMESNPVPTVDREAVQAAVDAAVKAKLEKAAAGPARSRADKLRDIASMEAAATEGVREAEQRRRAGRQVSRERVLAHFPGSNLAEVSGYATLGMLESRDNAEAFTDSRPSTG